MILNLSHAWSESPNHTELSVEWYVVGVITWGNHTSSCVENYIASKVLKCSIVRIDWLYRWRLSSFGIQILLLTVSAISDPWYHVGVSHICAVANCKIRSLSDVCYVLDLIGLRQVWNLQSTTVTCFPNTSLSRCSRFQHPWFCRKGREESNWFWLKIAFE